MLCVTSMDYFTAGKNIPSVGTSKTQSSVLLDNKNGDSFFSQSIYSLNDLLLIERESAAVGSSSNRKVGLEISAREIASICFSPPEREAARSWVRCCKSGNIFSARSILSASSRRQFVSTHLEIFMNCQ